MTEQSSPENPKDVREDLLQRTVERLFSVMRHIHRDIAPQEPFLSPPQARLVFTIARYKEEGISVKELAEKSDVTPGAITQFVDALATKDMVRREEDPNDRRMVRLKLTPAAKRQLQKLRKEFLVAAARSFDVLSNDELKQLIGLLSRISPQMDEKAGYHKILR